ncbi:thioredoxin family protein [Roseateles koreensis]|uniref:Thioredoxin family protein n=1 Tax=Roseateles koreensis TaxID=2987526 RepID=A0ABT5KRR4_9BURK|nr:thioredoxin family protein [Roseateles koreensis]MDC8785625.1 thioredoxin family protein [Roseateles koreensis]
MNATVPPTDAHARHAGTTLVACLCAAWCRTCDSYHDTFAELRQQFPGYRFIWVDIEDDEELVGDLDVETFPTLLIGVGEQLRFIGPVTPQLSTAQRLLESTAQTTRAVTQASPAAQALLVRLQSSC